MRHFLPGSFVGSIEILRKPSFGLRLRIVGDGVGVAQIFANVLERLHLLLPGLGPVGLAAGALRDALEDAARDRVLVHFAGRDHVDRNAFVLGHGAHVVGRHHAGVVGTVGEHDHHFAARHLGGVAQRQQQRVVERRIVARHALAQAGDGLAVIVRQDGGAREIAAEGVDRHRIGAIQAAHEIGDRVLGVHEALVHEVAGVEEHEDVGADERVGPLHARQRVLRRLRAAACVEPSSATASGALAPSAKVEIFCRMPSS